MRWVEYADIYQRQFENYKIGDKITMIEIGVQSGGSMITWNQWFNDANYTYIGVDFNPLCKQLDTSEDDHIHIEIGSQEDPGFLQGLCEKYGPFDIIIDDGGHTTKQMITSLRTLLPCVVDDGYYTIEDTHSMSLFPEETRLFEGKTIAQHISRIYENMHYYWSPNEQVQSELFDPNFSNQIKSIHLVDSMVTFVKKVDRVQPLRELRQGNQRIPFNSAPEVRIHSTTNEVLYKFKPFVAISSESFANSERKRLYYECQEFCYANGWDDTCAELVMNEAIAKCFGSGPDKAPELYDLDLSEMNP